MSIKNKSTFPSLINFLYSLNLSLKIESSINYKRGLGSTSPKEVKKAIQNAKKELY